MLYKHKAFSLLEMILTLVILSIIAIVGTRVTIQLYENHLQQQSQHHAMLKCELTLLQIVNRLEHALPSTLHIEKHALHWVSEDSDGFLKVSSGDQKLPAWSGFCDINQTLQSKTITTPGSNLLLLNKLHTTLNGGTLPKRTLHFVDTNHTIISSTPVTILNATQFKSVTLPKKISERYVLSWCHYGISYHPSNKQLQLHSQNKTQILATNVSLFQVTQNTHPIELQLCIDELLPDGSTLQLCREKVVYL
jgi:prepilin-type N-terminal cleavage/methylation domain-containing protein